MTRHPPHRKGPSALPPNAEETREHVLAAGRELLLAAQGALRFCQGYVEAQVPEASRTGLLGFFQKAIAVADELGSSLCGVTSITKTAGDIARPIFTAMEREMRGQHEESAKTAAAGKRPAPKTKSAGKRRTAKGIRKNAPR